MRFLENRPEENILVVTHGFFLRIIMAYVTFGSDVPAEAGELFVNKFHMANSGLTILKYDEQSKRTPWWLWTWNDHAHLAE